MAILTKPFYFWKTFSNRMIHFATLLLLVATFGLHSAANWSMTSLPEHSMFLLHVT